MTSSNNSPSDATIRAVLDRLSIAYADFYVQPFEASYSNHTHRLDIQMMEGGTRQIVIRRYNEANGDCVGKARREFHTLVNLQRKGFPAPKPLYLDDEGMLLGAAGIITEFVAGKQIEPLQEPERWTANVEEVAQALALIHATPYDAALKPVLMNGNVEAAWFTTGDAAPDYMRAHPDGAMVWETVREFLPQRRALEPVLIHLDYWSGNILWHEGQISAVVDWEEAAYGDPAIDVAYCRMELYLVGLEAAAEQFLAAYEQEAGQKVANLGVWELAASARPMIDLEGWLTRPSMAEAFRRFIAQAKARLNKAQE